MNRDDFPRRIKDAVAKRAAFYCSNPKCNELCIGPAEKNIEDVNYYSKIAHITAASEGGPRYDKNINTLERKSANNAIFLCSNCADMIDKNEGIDFPKEKLHQWKKIHEGRIKKGNFSLINDGLGHKNEIQDLFEFIYKFIENVFNGYRLDFIMVIDNILEIKEKRGKFRKYFEMIFNPLEIDEDYPYAIECNIRFLEDKYRLSFYADPQERYFFDMGGDLQISYKNEDNDSEIWSNLDSENPREVLDKIWQDIKLNVEEKFNYNLKIPDIQLFPVLSEKLDKVEELWRSIVKNLQMIKTEAEKNKFQNAFDTIELFIERYPNIIKKIEIRYGVNIKFNKEKMVITITDKENPNYIKLKLRRRNWTDSFGKYKEANFYFRDIIKKPPQNNEWHRKNIVMKDLLDKLFKIPKEDLNVTKSSENEYCIMKIWSERWDGRTDMSAGRNGKNWDEYRIKWTETGWYIKHIAINGECDKTGEPFLYRNLRQDFISYPSDLTNMMKSLWYAFYEENLSQEQLQIKIDEISERINICEKNKARLNPNY